MSAIFARFIIAWVRAVERAAVAVIVGTIAISAILFYYTAGNLTVNTDTGDMISSELPFRRVYGEYKRLFPQFVDNLLVVIESDTPELAGDTAAMVADRMRHNGLVFNHVFAPSAEPFFERGGLMYLDVDELVEIIDRLAEVEPLLATLTGDPSLRGLLDVLGRAIDDAIEDGVTPAGLIDAFDKISAVVEARIDGRTRYLSWQNLLAGDNLDLTKTRLFIVAQPRMDFSSLQPARAALSEIRAMSSQIAASANGDVTIRITGQAALNTEELSSVSRGASLAGAISLLLVSVVLIVGMRSVRLVGAALVTLIVGLIWTASFATVAIGYLNMISVAFAVLFIGLGIDFGIHFCLRYREEIDRGCENEKALRNSAAGAGLALALCAPTTAVAFYAFIPTAYAGLGQLGLISGTGMFIALAASLTVLPALLTVIPVKPKLRTGDVPAPGRAAAWVRRHGRPISGSALVLGLLALPLIGAARFDIDPMRLRDPGTESVQTVMRLFGDPDSSPYTLQILASGDGAAADLARRLEVLPEVDRAVTLASLIPDDQDEKLEMIDEASLFLMPVFETGEPDAPPGVPERRAALADFGAKLMALEEARASPALLVGGRRLLEGLTRFSSKFSDDENAHAALERALFRFLPHQVDKLGKMLEADYISRSNLPEKLRTRYAEPGGQVRIEVFPSDDVSDQDALRQFVRAVQAVVPDVTGPTVQIVEAGDAVVGSMRQATLWAAILITLFLFVVLRRTRDVLLVLAPLALAGLYTVAATVLLGLSFNFANVIVLPLLIGLGVDGGIHLVMRARERSSDAALLETSTPRAVLLSSLTTIGSFGSLAISSHRGTASMGELLMVAIAITLVCMLIILPAMMVWFESPEDPDRH